MLAIGNGEKCPFCDTVLDNRKDKEGENILLHFKQNHINEFLVEMDKHYGEDIS